MVKLPSNFDGFPSVAEYENYITAKRAEKGKKPTKHQLAVRVDSTSSWYQEHLKQEGKEIPEHHYRISTVGVCVCHECLRAANYFISQLTITYDRPATQEELAEAARAWNRQ